MVLSDYESRATDFEFAVSQKLEEKEKESNI
jgi:hypothetical protein